MSCDKYEDTWKPFFQLKEKYWQTDIPTYVGTETKDCKYANTIKTVGSWTSRVRQTLEQIDSDYVIFMLDDFFIREYVDQERIIKLIEKFDENAAVYNFEQSYDYTDKDDKYGFKLRRNQSQYLCSCQPSLWNRKILIEYLQEDMTPHEWELQIKDTPYRHYINASELIINIGYYIPKREAWGIVAGKWAKEMVDLDKKESLNIDFSKRGVLE
jgi:hypothetical protein